MSRYDGTPKPHYRPKPKIPQRRRRLDRDRFQCLPQPKPLREIDTEAMSAPRNTHCQWCGRSDMAVHRHHIKTKGSGGSDRYTVDLCVQCHANIHSSNRNPSRSDLEGMLNV